VFTGNVKRYTQQHEWIEIDDQKVGILNSVPFVLTHLGVVGITDYAQQLLGDVVFVELPPIDSFVSRGGISGTIIILILDELGAVESVKSASDIYAPMSGQILEVNEELTSKPSLINKSAEGDGKLSL
jgi:glycine cleavage system H protein